MAADAPTPPCGGERLDVLVLYDANSVATEFVAQHLAAMRRHSRHHVHFAAATGDRRADFPLDLYDALIVHFSVRMPFDRLSPQFAERIGAFDGPKLLMIQDEYDMPAKACAWIRQLGITVVFTTVPPEFRHAFYPAYAVPGVEFRRCLTGYVPDQLPTEPVLPIAERPYWLVYRGRKLPLWYGKLAREKFEIGVRMRAVCRERGIPHDIEWDEDKRITGRQWFAHLARGRATLGSESGSNVVDFDGSIRAAVQATLRQRPGLSEEEIYASHVAPFEGRVRMNQISPKIFEAIALRTGLVLFEGDYSGVIRADEHFIPLRKDFANIEDVLRRVADAAHVEGMVARAYEDVVAGGRYAYRRFVADVDAAIDCRARPRGPRGWVYAAVRCDAPDRVWSAITPHMPLTWPMPHRDPPKRPLLTGRWREFWLGLPEGTRQALIRVLGPAARLAVRFRRRLTGR